MTLNNRILVSILTIILMVGCTLDGPVERTSDEAPPPANTADIVPTLILTDAPQTDATLAEVSPTTPPDQAPPEPEVEGPSAVETGEEARPVAEESACTAGVRYDAPTLNDSNLWAAYQSDINRDYNGVVQFWQATFPQQWGSAFPGVCHTVEYLPDAVPFQNECGITPEIAQSNAFYCPAANAVMWDGPTFYHQIYQDLGDASLTFITAHEYGHAAQILSGTMPVRSVNAELQADCYAGAYLGFAAENGMLSEGDAREVILIVAAVGQSRFGSTWLTRSHGTSLQREAATVRGFEQGVSGCQVDFTETTLEDIRPDDGPGIRR